MVICPSPPPRAGRSTIVSKKGHIDASGVVSHLSSGISSIVRRVKLCSVMHSNISGSMEKADKPDIGYNFFCARIISAWCVTALRSSFGKSLVTGSLSDPESRVALPLADPRLRVPEPLDERHPIVAGRADRRMGPDHLFSSWRTLGGPGRCQHASRPPYGIVDVPLLSGRCRARRFQESVVWSVGATDCLSSVVSQCFSWKRECLFGHAGGKSP